MTRSARGLSATAELLVFNTVWSVDVKVSELYAIYTFST